MINVGILGHGVVGSGVAEILIKNADVVVRNSGQGIGIGKILDLRDFPDLSYRHLFTKDAQEILSDPNIQIIVECMGGTSPAFEFAKTAIENGKHFVTSNKALVAAHGEELFALARDKGVQVLYEASVGGGIPVIHPMRHCLGGNRINRVVGILNGTTNFILTRMKDGGVSFENALVEAQELGYAEADPAADVLGYDARRKICILAHVAFGAIMDDSRIPTQGIDQLTREDMLFARELDRAVKLLGVTEYKEEGWTARVCPTMLPDSHPLSAVSDVFNGVVVSADMVNEVMFYGPGAGKEPTASAMVGDIINIARNTPATEETPSHLPYLDDENGVTRYFVRVTGQEAQAAQVEAAMPGVRIVWPDSPVLAGSFGVVTPEGADHQLIAALDGLNLPMGAKIRFERA